MPFNASFNYLEVVAELPLYSSRAEVEAIWSIEGLDVRLDDDDDGTVGSIEEERLILCIAEATDDINGFATHQYDPSVLLGSRTVRRWASYMAASALSGRRGNPEQFCNKITRIELQLALLKSGAFNIPDIQTISDVGMAMSNMTIDRNYRLNPVRVDPHTSVGDDAASEETEYDWRRLEYRGL